MYDIATGLTLALAALSTRWLTGPPHSPRWALWGGLGLGGTFVIAARLWLDAYAGMAAAATAFIILVGAGVMHALAVQRRWPAYGMRVALCAVTVAGAVPRTIRFEMVADEALLPDADYYRRQALATANPVAAGTKSPLWPAMNAPIVRLRPDDPAAMRVLSWAAGIGMLPMLAFALGRLLDPVVGVCVAGLCTFDSWLVHLCCEGLRDEFNLILWLAFAVSVFRTDGPRAWGWLWGGLIGGTLLLLRNTNLAALLALWACVAAARRWRWWQTALVGVMPLIIASPFYVNQWRRYGDPFALERRDARFYVNAEFGAGRRTPVRPVPMPTESQRLADPFAGPPVSPFDYLVRVRPWREALGNQFRGLCRILLGLEFGWRPPGWFGVLCAAGLAGLLVLPARWAPLFVLGSGLGMQAHLAAIGLLEERHILQAYPFWLAGGVSLLVFAARAGLQRAARTTRSEG